MADSLMHGDENHYVVLETNQSEQLLTSEEMVVKLRDVLRRLPESELPSDLLSLPTVEARVKRLLDTVCEIDLGPGEFLQWYVVRLEK
ncbi:chlororespiratory reduction protein 7 [Leptolyngbya sp. FACHB-261]|uniref:chlororespiratory reduction protein 7 n=1 Tax=Leptolyngbya sp. FACHB-261 TaxID=2692806 RepID=UPI0016856D24|nr:chlororespiratory reduction protein 7 [Leptolyngbya sp. FACHB-261]MBD2105048.1 chlororespiratory reduction protein 7 [Leptolyngbya sp. FACHB-261]